MFEHRALTAQILIAAVDELATLEDLEVPVSVRIDELDRGDPGTRALGFKGRAPLHLHQSTVLLQR